jgi:hypothetical protein
MARARNIKPSFFDNEQLAALPAHARLLFIGLWTIADAYGKLEDRPARIKNQLLGYENVDAEALLKNLEQSGFIERYSVGEIRVIRIPNFIKHQHPHPNELKKASEYPDPIQVTDSKRRRNKSGKEKINPDNNGAHGPLTESPLLNTESLKGAEPSASAPALPIGLNLRAWERWQEFRRKLRLKPYQTDEMAVKLSRYPPDVQAAAVQHSIENQYQGVFPEKFSGEKNAAARKKYSVWDQLGPNPGAPGGPVVVLQDGGDLHPEVDQSHYLPDSSGTH